MIGAAEFAAMKPGVTVFNFARGGIVNNTEMLKALADSSQARGYFTDFGSDEILNRKDVVVTPHIGGSTGEAETNGAVQGAETIMNFLETGNVQSSVNLPNLQVPFGTPYRITVMHQNIPNMVGQIATILANANINIENMSNAAKDKVAYTIIDVNHLQKQDAVIIDQLSAIEAVYRLRLIKK